ncbi:MAG: alpha/beta hydrolase [Verrucomicrobia bacterium]|nr:alpha/beta hydrolase [Verrucomicrobiota bacterium]
MKIPLNLGLGRPRLAWMLVAAAAFWAVLGRGGEGQAHGAPDVAAHMNLPYVASGDRERSLDLYVPRGAAGVPLIIWIHGGAFALGQKEGSPAEPVPLHLLLRGYAIASLNYRLSDRARFPAQLEDCKAAVRWLRAHAGEFGLDPDRFGVWGASAGGTLAALLGTTGELRAFDVGENLAYSSRVQAVCDFYGPTDLVQMDAAGQVRRGPNAWQVRLIGGSVQQNYARAGSVNPIAYVTRNAPPFLVVHGTRDQVIPFSQSQLLVSALRAAGVPVQVRLVEGAGHGVYFGLNGGSGLYADPQVQPLVERFFAVHLKPTPP